MPEKRTKDYANGRIYAIYNYIDPSLIYVGSTCQSLSKRLSKHRREINSRKSQTIPLYVKMREIGKEHFYMELIEEYPCENNDQSRAREGYHIRKLGTLNGFIECRTRKEWEAENQQYLKGYRKKRWLNKKEEVTKLNKQRFTCECGVEMSNASKSRHQYSTRHQAYLNQQQKYINILIIIYPIIIIMTLTLNNTNTLTANEILVNGTNLSDLYATKGEVGNNAQITANTDEIAIFNTKQLQNFNNINAINTDLSNNNPTNTQLATNFTTKQR